MASNVLANAVQTMASKLAQYMPNCTMYSTDEFPKAETIAHTDVVAGASVIASKWDAHTMGCVQSNVARTILTADSHPAYNPQSAQQKSTFRSILMKSQQCDVTLTTVDPGTGEFYVYVDRLYGSEVNEYTMLSLQARFPANLPAERIKNPAPWQSAPTGCPYLTLSQTWAECSTLQCRRAAASTSPSTHL